MPKTGASHRFNGTWAVKGCYRQGTFEIKNDIFKIEKSSVDDNKQVLTINRQPIGEWFKEQWEKLRQGLRQSAENPLKVVPLIHSNLIPVKEDVI